MRILLDANVLLDLFLARTPWDVDAKTIWNLHLTGHVEAFVCAITPDNLHYIIRKEKAKQVGSDPSQQQVSLQFAHQVISEVVTTLLVAPVDKSILQAAVALNWKDFEDAIHSACATEMALDAIVTRDKKGFQSPSVQIFQPDELLNFLASQYPEPPRN